MAVALGLDDADGPPAALAIDTLTTHQPIDLEQKSAAWREEGWTGGTAPEAATGRRSALSGGVRLHSREVAPGPGGQTEGAAAAGASSSGEGYDEFVDEIARDTQHPGRDWEALEPEVRRSFERRFPDSPWDRAKERVRRGYERRRPSGV